MLVVQELHLTTMELQLAVKIVEFLLDASWTRAVLAHTEGQQHVDLKGKHTTFTWKRKEANEMA